MKTILHISADFPDPLVPAKTKAVQSLIDGAPGYRHIVYSLNRVSWKAGVAARPFGEEHRAVAYGAPPYGMRLAQHLRQLADFIEADLKDRELSPDLIHAHKLTVEGLVVEQLADNLGAPFAASIWGDTDRRIFEAKPNLRPAYRRIARKAEILLPAAPWTERHFCDALQVEPERMEVLPIITKADAIMAPRISKEPHLVSVFALDSWQRKGFETMVRAVAKLSQEMPKIRLDLYGRGGPKALLNMTQHISRLGMENHVRIAEPLDHGQVQQAMNNYAGFVLPSSPETYGMVYVEALLAGVPILWSRNEGVDGLFDSMGIGYRCDPQSVDDVAAGMKCLIEQQQPMKGRLAALHAEDAFAALRACNIAAQYGRILRSITEDKDRIASAA
jgi:glycosyltransferase involved in cell wall biosynthesis